MKRTRDDPSHFPHESAVYDDDVDDEDSSSSESGEFQPPSPSPSPQPPLQQRKHFCVICSKQFSSGKAYGGHVRIHSSEYNNKGKTKTMKKRKIGLVNKDKEKDLIRADVEGKIRCFLCRKEFQTMQSLFGHMRRHPDRSWKGIRPPSPEKLKLNLLDEDDDEVVSDVTEDVHGAACCLMMLNYEAGLRIAAMEAAISEVRSYNEEKRKRDGEMDDNGLTVDMKIKMEIELKVNNPQDEAKKRSLGVDLNQPYHDQDPPYSY